MLMSRLKEATRPHHDAIEARLGPAQFTSSREGYLRVLRRFYGFHRPAEEAFSRISGWDALGLDPAGRRKVPLLEADLAWLGLSGAEVQALPSAPTPPLGSLAQALGAMYVLEGSTLGGRYIRRGVEEKLGLTPGAGCSYFASYGDRVGAMWKAFGEAVDAFAAAGGDADAVVASATSTFRSIDAWFAADGPAS